MRSTRFQQSFWACHTAFLLLYIGFGTRCSLKGAGLATLSCFSGFGRCPFISEFKVLPCHGFPPFFRFAFLSTSPAMSCSTDGNQALLKSSKNPAVCGSPEPGPRTTARATSSLERDAFRPDRHLTQQTAAARDVFGLSGFRTSRSWNAPYQYAKNEFWTKTSGQTMNFYLSEASYEERLPKEPTT